MSALDQEDEDLLNLALAEERILKAPQEEHAPTLSLEDIIQVEVKAVQLEEKTSPDFTEITTEAALHPTPGGILPHYLTIDFQGCQLNVNFYDAPQNEGAQKPIAQHDVLQKEEILPLSENVPERVSVNPTCDQPGGCIEAEDILLPPLSPAEEVELPKPDPIWFA